MADRKVSYILDVDYEGESIVLRAQNDLRDLGAAGEDAAAGIQSSSNAAGIAKTTYTELKSKIDLAIGAFETVGAAAGVAYDQLSSGADLVRANEQFDNLARSVGSTGDAMRAQLSDAMQGLVTDTAAVGLAAELLNLKLTDTAESTIRLASVAAQLNWDPQILSLTLANQSTARLDALQLAIADVLPRAQELEAQGYATDQAFTFAVIEAGEDKIVQLGNAAETTAGQLQMIEVVWGNVQDQFKIGLAEGAAAGVNTGATGFTNESDQLEAAAREVGTAAGGAMGNAFVGAAAVVTSATTQDLEQLALEAGVSIDQIWAAYDRARAYGNQQGLNAYQVQIQTQRELNQLIAAQTGDLQIVDETAKDYAYQMQIAAANTAEVVAQQQQIAGVWNYDLLVEQLAQVDNTFEGIVAKQQLAAETSTAWAEYTDQLTRQGADNFTNFASQIETAGDEVKSLDQIIYDAAQGAGAGIDFLGDFGVDAGLIDETTAATAEAMAQQVAIAESLAEAVRNGILAWEEYPDAVNRALAQLEGTATERPTPRPSGAQIYEPGAEPVRAYQVPVEVEMKDEAIQTAVNTAIGIVEGFINPDEAYEAVMSMDISDVETKAGTVESIIANLPDRKDITISLQTSGLELIQELQAAGVIP